MSPITAHRHLGLSLSHARNQQTAANYIGATNTQAQALLPNPILETLESIGRGGRACTCAFVAPVYLTALCWLGTWPGLLAMRYEHGLGRLRLTLPTSVVLQQRLETLPDQAYARRGLASQAFVSVKRAGTVHVSGAVSHQPRSGQQNLQKEPGSGQPITLDHELHEVQGRIKPSTSELQCPAHTSSASRRHNHDGR
jgi:hypothetical protein